MKRPVCGHLGGISSKDWTGEQESLRSPLPEGGYIGLQRGRKAAAECDEMCRVKKQKGSEVGLQRRGESAAEGCRDESMEGLRTAEGKKAAADTRIQ